ncbi:hypothetical protein G6F50_013156 [Rhizopus delemar]|uniref:Uncharacterized protein n=1 Tax=Rhizopus delemar TaxID=936053 RepID=A0A9P7CGG6_9FUNG|nr:hypothetical protein G6F50_013156 [Rhizopus delemar]
MPPSDAAGGRSMREGRGLRRATGIGRDNAGSRRHSTDTEGPVAVPDSPRPGQRYALPVVGPDGGNGDGTALGIVAAGCAPTACVCVDMDTVAYTSAGQAACRARGRALSACAGPEAVAALLRPDGDGPVPAVLIAFATGVSV